LDPVGEVYSRRILHGTRGRRHGNDLPNAPLELFTFEHYASATACAHHANVSAGTSNGPYIIAARMLFAEPDLHAYNNGDSLHRGYEPLPQ
jgi:hypothetical protein